MEQDAVQKIQQRIAELPADVQTAIQSSDLHAKILAIGTKYQLHLDQVGELEDEVMLAMLGFSSLESLGERLSQLLRLTPQVGEQIAGDINMQLFASIRESMKKFAAAKTQAANPTPTQPAAVTPATSTPPIAPNTLTPPPTAPDMHKADVVLTEKTVWVPPTSPSASTPGDNPIYKTDPYREPI